MFETIAGIICLAATCLFARDFIKAETVPILNHKMNAAILAVFVFINSLRFFGLF